MAAGSTCAGGVWMPSKSKSHLIGENATLRARLAELEDKLASRPSGKGEELPESVIADRKRIEHELKASEVRYRRLLERAKDGIPILDAAPRRITVPSPF